MKRLIVLISVVLLGTTGFAHAQKVNEAALSKKIATAETASKDPKKNTKPAAWLALGSAYLEAATATTTAVFPGMDEMTAQLTIGKTDGKPASVKGVDYKVLTYPYMELYYKTDGLLDHWIVTKQVFTGDLDKAADAFAKAYSLDKSNNTVKTATEGTKAVVDAYKKWANNEYTQSNYKAAAGYFGKAFDVSKGPVLNMIDSVACYNVGVLSKVAGDYETGAKYLEQSIAQGYVVGGDAFHHLAACYNQTGKSEQAKQLLMDALTKYPQNTGIIESLLNVYATTGEDPTEIIPSVNAAIAANPTNPDLYVGLGRVYEKMGRYDDAIQAFQKTVELLPDNFIVNRNLGYAYTQKADDLATQLNAKRFTSQSAYDTELKKVYEVYQSSLAPLEKAYKLDPKDVATVELLKNVYFRLRDEAPEMMAKYNEYNTLYKSMQE